ncbi:MAG: DUF4340 domain-containing protein, partial [Myxococcaceae bacterium]
AELQKPEDGGSIDIKFSSIEVHAKGDTTKLERGPEGWRVVSPVNAPADKIAVDALSSQLQTAKFKEKLEENPTDEDLAKYGLKDPKFTVIGVASFPDGTTKTVKLEGGIDNPFDNSVYMRRDGDKAVYTGEGGFRYSLEKSSFDLRDKELFNFDEPRLKELRVKGAGGVEWAIVQDGLKKWRMTKPMETPADTSTIRNMLVSFRGERAQAFLQDSPEKRKALGLETPLIDATFVGDETVRVRMATASGDAGSGSYALIERTGNTVLAEVRPTAVSVLGKKPDDLKDKTLVQIDANAVAKVTITPANSAGDTVTVERAHGTDGGKSDQWMVTSPQKQPAKAFKISALLWSLGNLKASTFGEENPKDWNKYGVGPKSETITLFDESGKVLGSFVRGKDVPEKPGLIFARGTKSQVAEVEVARLADLPISVADFADTTPSDAGVR